MIHNVGGIDRIARILGGVALLVLAATDQIGVWGWVLGAVVLATGVFSFCGLYTVLGVNTCPVRTETSSTESKP